MSPAFSVSTFAQPHLRRWRWLVLLLVCLPAALTRAQTASSEEEADGEEQFVVIKADKVIPVVGKEVDNGMIIVVNGKVRNVGRGLEYPLNAKVIEARDLVVMPGLINPRTRFGLGTYNRSGVHSNLTVEPEFFPRNDAFEPLLDAGYTTAGLVPWGAGIPGRAMVVRLGGPTEQRILTKTSYLVVDPSKQTLREGIEKAKKEIEKVENAQKEFDEKQKQAKPTSAPATQPATSSAPASQPAFQPPQIDPTVQVLVDLLQKKEGVFALVEVRSASDYLHFEDLFKQYPLAHQYYLNNSWQTDFYHVAAKIGEQKYRVLAWPYVSRVQSSAERVHVVRQLVESGAEVSLIPINDSADEHARMLGRTSELVREGLSREEALKALTLNPARLLGLDARLGSIEKGKEADLIFLTGDPLAAGTQVRKVMIGGQVVHTVSREKQ